MLVGKSSSLGTMKVMPFPLEQSHLFSIMLVYSSSTEHLLYLLTIEHFKDAATPWSCTWV